MREGKLTGLFRPHQSMNYVINSSLQVNRWICIGHRIFLWCFAIRVSTEKRAGYMQRTCCSSTWDLPATAIRITWFDAFQSVERKLARSAQLLSGSELPNAPKNGIFDERNCWARGSPQSEKWVNVKINNEWTHTWHTSPDIASCTHIFALLSGLISSIVRVLLTSSAPGASNFHKRDSWY
jgi:hypothetical protein